MAISTVFTAATFSTHPRFPPSPSFTRSFRRITATSGNSKDHNSGKTGIPFPLHRIITTSTSFHQIPLINNSRVAARSVHSTTPTIYPDDESKYTDHLRYVFECFEFEKNPYLTTGPEKFCNVEEDEDALYARIDMPGIVKEGLVLQVLNGSTLSLHISGDECASKSKFQAEESRIYVTAIAVPADKYRTDQIRALLKNGVLRIVVPKVKNGEKRTWSSVDVHITVEDLPDQYGCGSLTLSSHHGSHTISPTPTVIFVCCKIDNYTRAVHQLQNNIFIVKGPMKILSYETVGEVEYLRLDMPGVGKDGVKLWLEGNFLCFEGVEEEDKDLRYDKETQLRKYEGCLPTGKSDQIKAYFENGVLRVSMPPFDVEEFNKWCSDQFIVKEHIIRR